MNGQERHEQLRINKKPTCLCGYACKTDAGLQTHIKNATVLQQVVTLQKELEDARKEIEILTSCRDHWKVSYEYVKEKIKLLKKER